MAATARRDDEAFATRCCEQGIVVAPGSYFGAGGAGYVRIALVPTLEECERARPAAQLSLACRAALSPPQVPVRGSASTAPVWRLRRNSSPFAPRQLDAP